MTTNGDLDRWSHTILDVFHQLQSVSGFLVDHWKELAAIWATFKIGSMASGVAGGLGGLAGAIGGNIGGAMGLFSKGLGSMAASMGPVVAGLGALYLAMDALIGWIDKKMDVSRKIGEHGGQMMGATGILSALPAGNQWTELQSKAAHGAVKELMDSGALVNGKLEKSALIANVGHMTTEFKEQLADKLGIRNKYLGVDQMGSEVFADALVKKLMPILAAHPELLPGAAVAKTSVEDDSKRKFTGKNVIFTGANTFNMKFDDVDPDRVWVGMKRNVEQEAEHRTQSVYTPAWAE